MYSFKMQCSQFRRSYVTVDFRSIQFHQPSAEKFVLDFRSTDFT